MAEKNSAQTNRQTDKQTDRQTYYENNGHLAVNQYIDNNTLAKCDKKQIFANDF